MSSLKIPEIHLVETSKSLEHKDNSTLTNETQIISSQWMSPHSGSCCAQSTDSIAFTNSSGTLKNGEWPDLREAVLASGPSCCAMPCCAGYGNALSSMVKMYEQGMPLAHGSYLAGVANNTADAFKRTC